MASPASRTQAQNRKSEAAPASKEAAIPTDPTAFAIEAAGWIGALLILVAYALVSTGRLEPRHATFQWMNLVGAAGFVLNSGFHGAWPSTILNVIWIAIAAASLVRLALK